MRKSVILIGLAFWVSACQQPESPPAANENGAQSVESSETVAVTASPAADSAACALSIGWDPWEPYHYAPVGNRVQGLDVDLIESLAESVGCELGWEQHSWASMLPLIRLGDLDLLPGATKTAERETFSHFSEPYREESFRIHVRADETDQWSGQSLTELLENGFRLGLTRGYIYGDQVEAVLDDPAWQDQLVEVPVGELNLLNLMDFRIDGFLEDPVVAANIGHRRDWGMTFEALPLDVHSGDVHLMFSRQSVDAERVEQFNAALAELKASGEHQRIVERYTSIDD